MLTSLEYLYGILMPNATMIGELTDCTPSAGVQLLMAKAAGDTLPSFVSSHGLSPAISFRTPALKTVLDACGLWGYNMSGGNCDLHYRSATNLSTRGTSGTRIRAINALMYWTSLSARQNGLAEISCNIQPVFDGTNAPMTAAGSIAVPTAVLAQEHFTLGPVFVNGSQIGGIQDINVDLGVKMNIKSGDGENYPSWCGIDEHSPVVTITAPRVGLWANFTPEGTALSALSFGLRRKLLDSASNASNASAVHILFTATGGGAIFLDPANGGINDPANCTLKIHLRRSAIGTSHCLSVATTSTLTA
jgi:hypothetical protein